MYRSFICDPGLLLDEQRLPKRVRIKKAPLHYETNDSIRVFAGEEPGF